MANISTIKILNTNFAARPYGTCSTSASTAAKAVAMTDFSELYTGASIIVKFTYANTASSPTLNVNSKGAKTIRWNGATLPATQYWAAGAVVEFIYDGTYWNMTGAMVDNNTTYTIPTSLPANGGTATNSNKISVSASTSTLYITGVTGTGHTNLYSGTQSTSGVRIVSGSKLYAYNGFFQESDERLKNFGGSIKVNLDDLRALNKTYFTFKTDPNTTHIGVVAQEIQKLYPEIVGEDENGMLSVQYDKLSVIALKAVDELYDRNKELEARIEKLEKLLIKE